MPFKSIRQARYLFKFHPRIAKRWTKESGGKVKVEKTKRGKK